MQIIIEEWRKLEYHPEISEEYYISSYGRIKYGADGVPHDPEYASSNGYLFGLFRLNHEAQQMFSTVFKLFPIDELVGLLFIPIPEVLYNKRLEIVHDNGDTTNNYAVSMHWKEDIEHWVELDVNMGGYIPIPNTYEISNHGRIKNLKTNNIISPYIDNKYYKATIHMISLKSNCECHKNIKLHRALAMSFNIPGYIENSCDIINHIDGNGLNFRLKNLEWCDTQSNAKHANVLGLEQNPQGEYHPRAKFTDKQRACFYEIIIELKDIAPSVVYLLIKERLPNISRDDVKYAKNIIRKQYHIEFPKLINEKTKRPLKIKYSKTDMRRLRSIVIDIFDKYGITEVQTYENKYKKYC